MERTAEQRAKHREYMRARREAKRTEHAAVAGPEGSQADVSERVSVVNATRRDLELLTVPPGNAHLVAAALALAEVLDDPSRAPQFASVAARLVETMGMLASTSKPREADPLDEMRRAFYRGEAPTDEEGTEASH